MHLHSLLMDGQIWKADEEIREGWANHFQKLAIPLQTDMFDGGYKGMVDVDVDVLTTHCEAQNRPINSVRGEEITAALMKLKNNKAIAVMGLTSEHFKLGGCKTAEFLTAFLNYLISAKRVSAGLKEGILSPIFKRVIIVTQEITEG